MNAIASKSDLNDEGSRQPIPVLEAPVEELTTCELPTGGVVMYTEERDQLPRRSGGLIRDGEVAHVGGFLAVGGVLSARILGWCPLAARGGCQTPPRKSAIFLD